MVQGWIDNQLRPTDGSKPALPTTVRKQADGQLLVVDADNGKVDKERHSFTHHQGVDYRTVRNGWKLKPKVVDIIDVPRLRQQTEAEPDQPAKYPPMSPPASAIRLRYATR